MYALNLSEDNRILSACTPLPNAKDEKGNPTVELVDGKYNGMVVVESLPDGDVSDYLYIDGEYVYDPLPEPEEPEPSTGDEVTTDDMAAAIMEGVNAV